MNQVGAVWDSVIRSYRLDTPRIREIVRDECQKAYYELCERSAWSMLRKSVEVDFSSATYVDGYWMPADMVDVLAVMTTDGNFVYSGSELINQHDELCGYRWLFNSIQADPLVRTEEGSNGITITSGSTTISPAVSSTYVGEYLAVDGRHGVYKVATTTTITTTFWGDSVSGAGFVIRPAGTRRITIQDPDRDLHEKTVDIHYWAYPPPLYKAWQPIMLPASRPLELLTLIRVIGTYGKREAGTDRYRAEFDMEYARMEAMDPRFDIKKPLDIHGTSIAPGRKQLFKNRTTT